jgi:hypothetical protein
MDRTDRSEPQARRHIVSRRRRSAAWDEGFEDWDKQDLVERLLNEALIGEAEAQWLSERSAQEVANLCELELDEVARIASEQVTR